jgi:glycosyltransferase involved in cell wall biosynthesis
VTADATPLVSVIMPFKDAAPYLEEAAHSVLAQTWPAVELVLVDDGGTDGSDAVAERVRAADPDRVRIVAHPGRANRGIGASRRLGFREARGELLANLDGDDVWEPAHLEDQVRLLLRSPGADAVQGRAWHWWSWWGDGKEDLLFPLAFAPGVVVAGQEVFGAILRNGGYAPTTCAVLFRASLLGPWTEVLDDFPGMYEDQVLHAGLQLRARLVMSGATTAWYRQHSRSISAEQLLPDAASRFDAGRQSFLDWVSRQPELDDPDVREQLDRNIEELRRRSTGPSGTGGGAAPVTAPARSAAVRRLRRSAASLVQRAEQVREGRAFEGSRTNRAAQAARPERLRLLMQRHGADLRGRVLLLANEQDVPVVARQASVEHRALPATPTPVGPHHPLAALRSQHYDCVLVLDGTDGTWSEHDLRHLRRALRPGGVLLLEVGPSRVERLVRLAFEQDAVQVHQLARPGPERQPLRLLRAAVPA